MRPIQASIHIFVVLSVLLAMDRSSLAQETNVILYDNNGAEFQITVPGAMNFSIFGSNWSGGTVLSKGIPRLYASGAFAYDVGLSGAQVTFDTLVDRVDFFFVHNIGDAAATATAFNASNAIIGSVSSNLGTFFGDSGNFVSLNPTDGIDRIEFSGADIDNFSFTTIPEPSTLGMLIMGGLLVLRRRYSF